MESLKFLETYMVGQKSFLIHETSYYATTLDWMSFIIIIIIIIIIIKIIILSMQLASYKYIFSITKTYMTSSSFPNFPHP